MIPAEVWKNSTVTKEAPFEFLNAVWKKEVVPQNLVVMCFRDDLAIRIKEATMTAQNTER